MLQPDSFCLVCSLGILTLIALGCSEGVTPVSTSKPTKSTTDDQPAAEHDHPTQGPHAGELVELGNEEFHAEIVHGSGGEVAIYILDSKAAQPVLIHAQEITINLSHDGRAEQFKLLASPDTSDPAGQSSRFTIVDGELGRDLREQDVAAKLVVSILGKSYTGKIVHQHQDGASAQN